MSDAGKADSLAYAASFSDREAWQWKQSGSLSRKAHVTFLQSSLAYP